MGGAVEPTAAGGTGRGLTDGRWRDLTHLTFGGVWAAVGAAVASTFVVGDAGLAYAEELFWNVFARGTKFGVGAVGVRQ